VDLLTYWTWKNYLKDTDGGTDPGFHYNSNKPRIHDATRVGDSLWIVVGRTGPSKIEYILGARLHIISKTFNVPGYEHGRYRVYGDRDKSEYFDPSGPDMTEILLRLTFDPRGPISVEDKDDISNALRSMRTLTSQDRNILKYWAMTLDPMVPQ
jgi:hypothetical protein